VDSARENIVGRHHDTFHRIEGRWWFDTREMHVDLEGDLGHHLLFDIYPGPEASVSAVAGSASMVEKADVVGRTTAKSTIAIERGPVSAFARAVTDTNPIYQDEAVARAAGFEAIPIPPTFPFAMAFWGQRPEDQPTDAPSAADSPMAEVMGSLMATGGLILHGEQEFEYHRPVVAGEVLHEEGKVVDLYTKETKGRTMTFLVTETQYRGDDGEVAVTARFNLIHRA